ncbi:probable G-protein coupled receptor No18 [Ylistrum balloti]|uniref:probable G-protein coupled receptor No18 n=1 Tax=Ylistrum balloti TaxID=509963 RepID=UPI0029059BA8|nr:probable G-protein coupled receptor No18 [Ylistrum balloti]
MNTSSNFTTVSCDYNCWKKIIDQLNAFMVVQNVPILLFMCLLVVIGIPGNLIVIWIYCVRKVRTTANCFVITLACVDLTTCVVIHPYVISKLFNSFNQQQVLTCKLFEFLIHSTLSISAIVLFVVAVDRYLAICKPFHFLKYQKHATAILIITFVIGTIDSLPLLEFYGKRTIQVSSMSNSIVEGYICDYSDEYQGTASMTSFGFVMFVCFSVIVVGMMIMYINVARTAYKQRTRVVSPADLATDFGEKNLKYGNKAPSQSVPVKSGPSRSGQTVSPVMVLSGSSDLSSVSTVEHVSLTVNMFRANMYKDLKSKTQQPLFKTSSKYVQKRMLSADNNKVNEERKSGETSSKSKVRWKATTQLNHRYSARLKAAKILFLVTAVFLLSWLPFWVIRFCWLFAPSYMAGQSETGKAVLNFFMHLFYLNNAANPVIYTIINKNFRAECRQYWERFRVKIDPS